MTADYGAGTQTLTPSLSPQDSVAKALLEQHEGFHVEYNPKYSSVKPIDSSWIKGVWRLIRALETRLERPPFLFKTELPRRWWSYARFSKSKVKPKVS